MTNVVLYPNHFSELRGVLITHTRIIPADMIREQEDNLFITVIGNSKTIEFKYGLFNTRNIYREDSAAGILLEEIARTKIVKSELKRDNYHLSGKIFWFSPINREDTDYNIWVVEIMK